MPSPKAVLHDIADLGLNPAVAYTITDHGGRITLTPKPNAKQSGNQYHMTRHEPLPGTTSVSKEPEKKVVEPEKKVVVAPVAPPAPKEEPKAAEPAKPEPAKVEPKAEPVKVEEKKVEPPKVEPKVEAKKEESKPVPAAEATKPVEKPTDVKPEEKKEDPKPVS